METSKRRRSWLKGAALGVMLALLLAPATRWLVKYQILSVVTPRPLGRPLRELGVRQSFPDADPAAVDRALLRAIAEHILVALIERIGRAREQLDAGPQRISNSRIRQPVGAKRHSIEGEGVALVEMTADVSDRSAIGEFAGRSIESQ